MAKLLNVTAAHRCSGSRVCTNVTTSLWKDNAKPVFLAIAKDEQAALADVYTTHQLELTDTHDLFRETLNVVLPRKVLNKIQDAIANTMAFDDQFVACRHQAAAKLRDIFCNGIFQNKLGTIAVQNGLVPVEFVSHEHWQRLTEEESDGILQSLNY